MAIHSLGLSAAEGVWLFWVLSRMWQCRGSSQVRLAECVSAKAGHLPEINPSSLVELNVGCRVFPFLFFAALDACLEGFSVRSTICESGDVENGRVIRERASVACSPSRTV